MDSNTHSTAGLARPVIGQSAGLSAGESVGLPATESAGHPPGGRRERLAALAAEVDRLASENLDGLTDVALAEEVLQLRRLVDRLEGQWLRRVAAADARGAAGAERTRRSARPRPGS